MTVFAHPSDLLPLVGHELGVSAWTTIDQSRIDGFAELTGDHQWIHVEPERAKNGPFGGTIAHGFLTLSLVWTLASAVIMVEGVSHGVNYGIDRLRFTDVVPVGSRVRALVTLKDVQQDAGRYRTTISVRMEIEGSDRPACVLDAIALYFSADGQ